MADSKLSLKLLIDSKANKVVVAEADKEFVDFLFDILSLSVGTVMQVLKEKATAGCLKDLYTSAEVLNSDYILPNVSKDVVLKQRSPVNVPLLSLEYVPRPTTSKQFYRCGNFRKHNYVTDFTGVMCPECSGWGRQMGMDCTYVSPSDEKILKSLTGGYVKNLVKYIVMDTFEVKPMSLSEMKSLVKDTPTLIEKDVQVGPHVGLAILEASLKTQSVLTAVFLVKEIMKP